MKKRITRNRRYTDKTWNRNRPEGLSKRDFFVCEKLMLFANEETKELNR